MFESVGKSNNPSTIRRSSFVIVAIAFHVGLILWLYRAATAVAEEPKKPPLAVVFHQTRPPAPPPPAPASGRHRTHHEKHAVVHQAHQMVVPKVIPTQLPKAEDDSVDDGAPDGVVGGVKNGVPGGNIAGQIGGTGTGEPAPVYLLPGMIGPKELDPEACHPRYPTEAQAAGIHGMVIAEYTVTLDGRATNIQIKRFTNPVFEAAVRRALQRCRFQPATDQGRPLSVIVIRDFRFQMPQ